MSTQARQQLGRSFKRALAAQRRMRSREHRRAGELSDAQYGLLFCLRERHELSSSELAYASDLSPAAATELLEALHDAGLVQRTRSASDRRVVLTSLTERGRELVEERRARIEPRFRAALSQFSDQELLTAAAVLDRLAAMFDELAEEDYSPPADGVSPPPATARRTSPGASTRAAAASQ
jgi:DNA-binding MarR family transcriptional regulator